MRKYVRQNCVLCACTIISRKRLYTLDSTCSYLCERVLGGSQHSGWALPRPPPPGGVLLWPPRLLPETRASSLCKQRKRTADLLNTHKYRKGHMLSFQLQYMIGASGKRSNQAGNHTEHLHITSPVLHRATQISDFLIQFPRQVPNSDYCELIKLFC